MEDKEDFRKCPITDSTYINGVLKEAREDPVTSDEVVLNCLERINKRKKEECKPRVESV